MANAKKTITSKKAISTNAGFIAGLGAPAQRALQNAGISTIKKLAAHTEKEVMQLHGMGPSSLPKLKDALQAAGLSFKAVKTGK